MRKPKFSAARSVAAQHIIAMAQADEHDLSLRQVAVLALCLQPDCGRTIRGMAMLLGIPKPSVTRAVDRLEAAGFALRLDDPLDGRSVLVTATRSGAAFLARQPAA